MQNEHSIVEILFRYYNYRPIDSMERRILLNWQNASPANQLLFNRLRLKKLSRGGPAVRYAAETDTCQWLWKKTFAIAVIVYLLMGALLFLLIYFF